MEVSADGGRQRRYGPQNCLQIPKEELRPFLTIFGTHMLATLLCACLDAERSGLLIRKWMLQQNAFERRFGLADGRGFMNAFGLQNKQRT
jgi:hypothetical protein